MNFSVVMSVYKKDQLEFIKQAIESLLCQTLSATEIIIVVDGFVKDDVKEYLNTLVINICKIRVLFQEDNKGLATALNIGINAAKYDIIARMDADDICYPDRFENQLTFLAKSGVDVLGGQMSEFIDDTNNVVSERKVPLFHEDIVKRMKYLNPFSHPTTVFKKEVFDKLNGYDINAFPEDYDFFVRAYMSGFKLSNVKEKVLYFRLGVGQASMFKRRRGFNFLKKEYHLYKNFMKIGFYSFWEFLLVSMVKLPVRLLPTNTFKHVYNFVTR